MTVAISTHETRQVISAIVEVIDKGNVPAWAPGKYRQALRDLCDGRVDRTNRRKDLLERAEKGLAPVLEAADRQTLLSTNVETLFGGAMIYRKLQPGLPSPQLHEKFEHTYVAKGGETVAEVAKKYGYDNAGPLCHASYDYPPQHATPNR